jgi:histidinol-phosphate aminotransferase
MSRFLSSEAAALEPYTPGEQPQNLRYNKLNTNESPFPPSPKVVEAISREEILKLNLYSDPACGAFCEAAAKHYGLKRENVIAGNGSDELLGFAFRAFCGAGKGAAYADITYGFYKVWTRLYGLRATVVPLREDFTLRADDYRNFPGTIFLANPNAPTGIAVPPSDVRHLLEADPDRVVVVDEAYVDFGAESCVPLIGGHDNLVVIQTLSKSRNLAGGRIGLALGGPDVIADLNRVKYSFNPYNLNRLSIVAGAAAMEDEAYFAQCTAEIRANRAWTVRELEALGFTVLPSKANFLFARSDRIPGEALYGRLKERGVLVRHFDAPARITDFCRISVGSMEQMESLLREIRILLEKG